jgi:hypothetical protein
MNLRMIIFSAALLLYMFLGISPAQEKLKTQHYLFKISINPERSQLQCRAEIQHALDSCFILAKCFNVKRITSEGKQILFNQQPSMQNENCTEIIIERIPENLVIEYSGQVNIDSFPKSMSTMNMVRTGLVELSNQIDWFPRTKNFAPFTYQLELNVPSDYVTITNGSLEHERIKHKRSITTWKSEGLSYGITLLSAPELKQTVITRNGITIEIYYDKLPKSYIDSMKNNLSEAMNKLIELNGKPGANKLVRIVYSPRAAGGYARSPLIIVSEYYALEQRSHKYGFERDLRLNIHEIAHYWSLANTSTPDDWINEGLAEYSAYLISEELSGKDFADLLLKEYQDIVNNSKTNSSIIETNEISMDREINRYYKPVMLFNEISQKYGSDKLKKFFRNLYSRFLNEKAATTEIFLDETEKSIGTEAKDFFYEALHKKDMNNNISPDENNYTVYDSVFTGIWAGPLTQFGTSSKFVLNLIAKDGKLIPTLDSPDQGVKDIPVSEFRILGDTIMFKVAPASASFSGNLNRKDMTIAGSWVQRGTAYPLVLSKQIVTENAK